MTDDSIIPHSYHAGFVEVGERDLDGVTLGNTGTVHNSMLLQPASDSFSEFQRSSSHALAGLLGRIVEVVDSVQAKSSLILERIDDVRAGILKAGRIVRCYNEIMHHGRCGDEAVFDRHRGSRLAEPGEQCGPLQSRFRIPRQTVNLLYALLEPLLESAPALSFWQKMNTELNFTENNRVDGNFAFIFSEPRDNRKIWDRLRELAEDVRVDEIFHSVSVDSDSIGMK